MLGRLILLFIAVPFVELAILVWIGERIGALPTFALVVTTGVLGASLARHQGVATWARFRRAVDEGRAPSSEVVEGLLILIAGAVLLTPGILTDLAGFLLLTPPIRRFLARWAEPRLRSRVLARSTRSAGSARFGGREPSGRRRGASRADGAEIIDAEYDVLEPSRTDRHQE